MSILGLFDVVEYDSKLYGIVRALGPAGIALFAVGGTLCGWDLRGMREQARAKGD
jgi:hypothetical protein